jgi:hypothetical protein
LRAQRGGAARVGWLDSAEWPAPDAGTIVLASSPTPLDRSSWSQIVPQREYGRSLADPRLAVSPDVALYLWQRRYERDAGTGREAVLPFVRFRYSD